MSVWSEKTSTSGWRKWVYDRVATTATTTELADNSSRVNVHEMKVEGFMVFNVTTNLPVWAVGSAATSVWVNATGSTAHTPV